MTSWFWVKVPVLSKAKVLARPNCSRVGPDLTMTWCLDMELIPATMATGAAIKSGQGEATTMTSAKRVKLPEVTQAAIPMISEIMVNGTA